jgi:hypothetical protein
VFHPTPNSKAGSGQLHNGRPSGKLRSVAVLTTDGAYPTAIEFEMMPLVVCAHFEWSGRVEPSVAADWNGSKVTGQCHWKLSDVITAPAVPTAELSCSQTERTAMADFYAVPVVWRDGTRTTGRGVGNNAAWLCKCGEVLLGPHEGMYPIDPCPGCGKEFRIVRGTAPQHVDRVEQTA